MYRLIAHMWGRDSEHYDNLDGPVFEQGFTPKTVRARASEANKVLEDIGVPWRLKPDSVGRYLTKQPAE